LARGGNPYIDSYEGWDPHGKEVNKNFEMFLRMNVDLLRFSRHMFYVWDENNHHFQAWMSFIIGVHPEDAS
jgi:hypothetical protein